MIVKADSMWRVSKNIILIAIKPCVGYSQQLDSGDLFDLLVQVTDP